MIGWIIKLKVAEVIGWRVAISCAGDADTGFQFHSHLGCTHCDIWIHYIDRKAMKTRITQIHNLKDLIVKSADGLIHEQNYCAWKVSNFQNIDYRWKKHGIVLTLLKKRLNVCHIKLKA